MKKLFINNNSLDGALVNAGALEVILREFFKCVDVLIYALKNGNARFLFDNSIENKTLKGEDITFVKMLNTISDRDVARRWFIHTRNHADLLEGEMARVRVYSSQLAEHVESQVFSSVLDQADRWLSFQSLDFYACDSLKVAVLYSGRELEVGNSDCVMRLKKWWPQYEANPKHRLQPYTRSGGEEVAPMPLNANDAQEALDISKFENGERTASYKNKRFVFRLTFGNTWHGYQVDS